MNSTERVRRWRAENPERYAEHNKKGADRQRGIHRVRTYEQEQKAKWNLEYREKHPDNTKRNNAKRSIEQIRHHNDLRSIREIRSESKLDSGEIKEFYRFAHKQGLVIDHDVPLGGCVMCGAHGLHTLANLRAVTAGENRRKARLCCSCFKIRYPT